MTMLFMFLVVFASNNYFQFKGTGSVQFLSCLWLGPVMDCLNVRIY